MGFFGPAPAGFCFVRGDTELCISTLRCYSSFLFSTKMDSPLMEFSGHLLSSSAQLPPTCCVSSGARPEATSPKGPRCQWVAVTMSPSLMHAGTEPVTDNRSLGLSCSQHVVRKPKGAPHTAPEDITQHVFIQQSYSVSQLCSSSWRSWLVVCVCA